MRQSTRRTSPAFVGVIALVGITLSSSPTRAADECLEAPNSAAPPGSHWYYHVERSTQRKCWHVRPEDQQAHTESAKIEPAAKSSGATATGKTSEQVSRQTEPASTRPAAVTDIMQAEPSVSERSVAAPESNAADKQPTSSDKTGLALVPSVPVISDADRPASEGEKSNPVSTVSFRQPGQDVSPVQGQPMAESAPADSAPETAADQSDAATKSTAGSTPFTPNRVLLLIATALALIGVIAFAVFPSRLRNRIYTNRRNSNSDIITAQRKTPPSSNMAIAEPDQPASQIEMPDELKRNLRAVLQTLETQLRGDVELNEALAQRRSSKPAWG